MRRHEDALTTAALTLPFVALTAAATLQMASQRVCSVSESVSTLQMRNLIAELCCTRRAAVRRTEQNQLILCDTSGLASVA